MKSAHSGGFTLVELLVVITIMAILSVVGITMYSGVQSRAKDTQRLDDARKLVIAMEQFKSGAGRYPINTTGGCNPYCTSMDTQPWIPELDLSNFKDGKVPIDPVNTNSGKELRYYYKFSASGDDYCIQISQENNATGHPYFKDYLNNVWRLRFGPKGANSGQCIAF